MMIRTRAILLTLTLILSNILVIGQEKEEIIDYTTTEDYIIGGISVSGVRFLDPNALIGISGLRTGQEIPVPGDEITNAVKKLWQQGLFSDVRINIAKRVSDTVFLDIYLQERSRISSIKYNGLKNSEVTDLSKK